MTGRTGQLRVNLQRSGAVFTRKPLWVEGILRLWVREASELSKRLGEQELQKEQVGAKRAGFKFQEFCGVFLLFFFMQTVA